MTNNVRSSPDKRTNLDSTKFIDKKVNAHKPNGETLSKAEGATCYGPQAIWNDSE